MKEKNGECRSKQKETLQCTVLSRDIDLWAKKGPKKYVELLVARPVTDLTTSGEEFLESEEVVSASELDDLPRPRRSLLLRR